MISTEELSTLLADLYAAPLEPEKWQSFINRLCSLTHGAAAYMLRSDAVQGNALLAGGGSQFDPELIRKYNSHYRTVDPFEAPFMARPHVGLIHGDELVSHSSLVKTELYSDVLSYYGLEHLSLVCYRLEEGQLDLLSIWHDAQHGPIEAGSASMVASLIPHLRTGMRLHKQLAAGDAARTFSEGVLDAMSIAAFLVNERSQVKHMNRMASEHLAKGSCLEMERGKLVLPARLASAGQLEQMISSATSNELRSLDLPPGGSVRLSHFTVTILPIPERSEFHGGESYALVFVVDEREPPKSRAAVLRQLYGLTPTEARVADKLLDGFEAREIAEQLGITVATCRFHVKRVLSKTGRRRQAELIRLMLSLPGQ